jgi:3-methyladenine DNA glycosylase AlkD
MAELEQIRAELHSLRNPSKAEQSKRYLKSPYTFYGITVPQLRSIAKNYKHLSLNQTFRLFDELWNSGNHEEMSLALFLFANYKKNLSIEIWDFLMNPARLEKFKTWDHVDEACTHTLGEILVNNKQLNSDLKKMVESKNPWMRRISIVSQYPSIKRSKLQFAILFAEKLVYDEDIYVQKGTGWMLREAGKKSPMQLQEFIKLHKNMKPAAFSYATEKMLGLRKRLREEIKDEKVNGKKKIFEDKIEASKNLDALGEELKKLKYFKN